MNDDTKLSQLYEDILANEMVYAVRYKVKTAPYTEPDDELPIHTRYFICKEGAENFAYKSKSSICIQDFTVKNTGEKTKIARLPYFKFKTSTLAKIHDAGWKGIDI